MTNPRWPFWRRQASKATVTPEATPDADQTANHEPRHTKHDTEHDDASEPSPQARPWWRFGYPSPPRVIDDTSIDAGVNGSTNKKSEEGTAAGPKRRWWWRSRAAVPEQTAPAPRPLNPDGSLPPDLLEQFEREQQTNRAMRSYLRRFLNQVEQAEQQGNIDAVVKDVDSKLGNMERGKLAEVWQKVQTLGKLMRDPAAHWQSKAVAVASLVYVVSPLDAIPDVIPGLGLTDDVAVVVAVVSYLGNALNRYAKTELKEQLEDHSDREIKKHLLKNRISLLYAAAAAAFVLAVALVLQYVSQT
jgi:uncharacterized membrane protein YkvA (DUF1232 family)